MLPKPLRLTTAAMLVTVAAAAGCSSIGPRTVARDRFDYSSAVSRSWKEQTLLNIVKLRYLDLPVFLDVGQIVAGYTLEEGASLGGTISSKGAVQGDLINMGLTGRFTDRPTITYTPVTGDRFLRGMLEPIPPASVFFLLQSGYAADFMLSLTTESLCGLRNRPAGIGTDRQADPAFLRTIALLRELQASGGFGMRVEPAEKGPAATVLFFRGEDLDPELVAKIQEVKSLLRLPEKSSRFRLVFSPVRGAETEVAVQTRSLIQVLSGLGSYVEIPELDRTETRAAPMAAFPTGDDLPFHVKCSSSQPDDAYVAVPYRGSWFSIDDRDWRSKRAFGLVMFLFSLVGGGPPEQLPLLTISSGG